MREIVSTITRPWGRLLACLSVLAIAASGGCTQPKPIAPKSLTGVFTAPSDYSELLGTPPHPSATTLTLEQLGAALGLKYQWLTDDLLKHAGGKKASDVQVRLLESYSRQYPVHLQVDPSDANRSKVYLPLADGVFATQADGPPTCDSTAYVCETLSTPSSATTSYDVMVVVGWSIQLDSNVSTGGKSLVVVADRFTSGSYTLDTIVPPVDYPAPITDPSRPKAPSGNDGRGSGSLVVLVNELDSLHGDTTGQRGQNGQSSPAGSPVRIARCGTTPGACSYYDVCSCDGSEDPATGIPITTTCKDVTKNLTDGGDGGRGGPAGNMFVRYTTIPAVGEQPVSDAECFAMPNGCANPACGWNPSNAVCDHDREADDQTCSDKIDNDSDGKIDCAQASCSANANVNNCAIPARRPIDGRDLVALSWLACTTPDTIFRPDCAGPGRPDRFGVEPYVSFSPGVIDRVTTQLSFKLSFGDPGTPGNGPRSGDCPFRDGSWHSPDFNTARLDIKGWSRREVDILRSLLAPRQWRVVTAQANSLFKRTELGGAAFLYLSNIRQMEGALEQEATDCTSRRLPEVIDPGSPPADLPPECASDVGPTYCVGLRDAHDQQVREYNAKIAAAAVARDARVRVSTLLDVVCPELLVDKTKFGYLTSTRNYFGLGTNPPVNPRNRYSDFPLGGGATIAGLRTQFDALLAALRSQASLAVALSTSTDLKQVLSQNKDALANAADETAAEVNIAATRVTAAQLADQGARQAIENRLKALGALELDIRFSDARLQNQYDADRIAGNWFVKLTKAVAKYVGEAAGVGDAIEQVFGAVWDAAVSQVRNTPVRRGTRSTGDLADMIDQNLDGKYDMERDEVAEQVVRKVVAVEDQKLIIEVLDLSIAAQKAAVELRAAQDSLGLAQLRAANASRLAAKARQYADFDAPMSPLDVSIALHQAYATSTSLVEDLTIRYWELLRAADYQFLPYSSADGTNLIESLVKADIDFNLTNYELMQRKLVDVIDKQLSTGFSGSVKTFYRRINKPAFEKDTYADKLAAIGLGGVVADPRVLALHIGHDDLAADPVLKNQRKARVQQIRVNLVSATGSSVKLPLIYVARDTSDSFLVGRSGTNRFIAGFEIVPRDLYPDGSVKSPLHYQSMATCFSAPPACTLTDAACQTAFQLDTLGATCALTGTAASTPATNAFFNRSLVGDWLIAAPGAELSAITDLAAVEVMFSVSAEDL